MGVVDLRKISGDEIVIHYGGDFHSVDAYTFANSLIAFGDTIREINNAIAPNQPIEIKVSALAQGSFRAKISNVRKKGIGGLFKGTVKNVLMPLMVTAIYDLLLAGDDLVVSNTDENVVIQSGDDRIIIPKEVYEQRLNIKENPQVARNIRKTFEVLENDPAILNFGFTPEVKDDVPLIEIPQVKFPKLTTVEPSPDEQDGRRINEVQARLFVRKLWLDNSGKKWSFEWNGIPISAPVKDENFLELMVDREFTIGAGDALDVRMQFYQDYDEELKVWVNDQHSYTIIKVERRISKASDQIDFK